VEPLLRTLATRRGYASTCIPCARPSKQLTYADRQLDAGRAPGFSVLPFLVGGTDLVAVVPERLAVLRGPAR